MLIGMLRAFMKNSFERNFVTNDNYELRNVLRCWGLQG